MVRQASSWLHLDNGFISLWAMWKLCPSSLIHERWNEQESKILPRDILAVRLRGDPAPHSQGWGDSISPSLYCCFLLRGKRFKVATDAPVMIWLLEHEGNFSVISYLELRKGLWLEQNAPGWIPVHFCRFLLQPLSLLSVCLLQVFLYFVIRKPFLFCNLIAGLLRASTRSQIWFTWRLIRQTEVSTPNIRITTFEHSKSHNKQNLYGN